MDKTQEDMFIDKLNYDFFTNKIDDYNNVNKYDNSIYINNFKLNMFWEVARLKVCLIIFVNDKLKKSNLIDRIESEKNIIIYPEDNEMYLLNKNIIKFSQNFNYENLKKILNFFSKIDRNNEVIIYNYNSKNLEYFYDYNLPILSYINSNENNVYFIPSIIKINNLITFLLKKKIKVYYIGKRIVTNNSLFSYIFPDEKKICQHFLDINENYLKSIFTSHRTTLLDRMRRKPIKKLNLPNTKNISNINKIEINDSKIDVIENPKKNKRVLYRDYKNNLLKNEQIEYPKLTNIFKINFIIKNNPILDLSKGNPIELMEYQLMFNLIENYMIYYNSVLLNDKITSNNDIDMDKFMSEYNDLKENNYLYGNTIVKCQKGKFDLIFFTGDTTEDIDIYNSLPYPKILSSGIIPDIWEDDRHIISFPSKNYEEIISSGVLKDESNSLIKLPQRFIIKEKFLGPKIKSKSRLKSKYYADYLILLESLNENSIEISLLENLIEKYRVNFNKEICFLVNCGDNKYKSNNKWVQNISFNEYYRNINECDMIIILEDIWKNNYSLTYTILEGINYNIPLLLASNSLINSNFVNYPGLFTGLNDNIIGINDIKSFFEIKINQLLCDDLEEVEYLRLKSEIWNKDVLRNYKENFIDIINFLKSKNYQRKELKPITNNEEGINFYYFENINDLNLSSIYSNVEDFFNKIKSYKNILLISSDYPGYGGASSLNNEIAKILRLKGHNCKELYYLFDKLSSSETNKIIDKYKKPDDYFNFEDMLDENDDFFYQDLRVTKFNDLLDDLNNMTFQPDLIILKNHLNGIVLPERFKNIYYLVAGIYSNNLNKFYYNLSQKESEKFINKNVIKTLSDSRIKGISNSLHTQKILKDYFNISTELFYVNFIVFYPRKIPFINDKEFNNRYYDYGIICSDFNREIKNIKSICEDLADNIKGTDKIIFIGNNSNKFNKLFKNQKNITNLDLIPNYLVTDYLKKIKNVLLNSYYESNSNLAIQAKFNGCNVIRKPISLENTNFKILITSTQKPGYGGSATNAYKLMKLLRKLNYNVSLLYFNKDKIENINYEKIDGLFVCKDDNKNISINYKDKIKTRNDIINFLDGYPNVIYAFNYYTPILSRLLFPSSYIYYFVVGNPVLSIGKESIISQETSIQRFMDKKYNLLEYNKNIYDQEILSILKSDEIVIDQGELTINTLSKVHPKFKYLYTNYYNYGINIIHNDIKIYEERKEFELIVISSNWERIVKNPKLIYLIFKNLPQYRKLVIGNNSNMFDKIPNTTCLPLLDYEETQQYLAKSKILLITSFSETGPNTLIEAFSNKCQVLGSNNIGYQRYLCDYQKCNDVYDLEEWLEKIKYLVNNYQHLPIPKIDIEDDKKRFFKLIDHRNIEYKSNVLIVCGDKPYYGGAATNSYNLIKLLKKENYNVEGLFISYQNYGEDDPDNLGCVSHIYLDENIENKMKDWISKRIINYDIIFCKNYKIFVIIKKIFPNIPIIFSPSGLRQLTGLISKKKVFYQDIKSNNIKIINNEYKLIEDDNIFNFIMKNDKVLENYALETADYLIPNSNLTYNIIKENYNENITNKLLEPIYISNIQFIEQINFNFRKRKYDFVFVATNWKRATKNIWLVKSLIKKLQGTSYNILVIGENHDINEKEFSKKDYPNLEIKDHLLRDELINLYQNVKTIVITSFYESNPNVLVEAIYCGCNIVCSENCGNSINLRNNLIVSNPNNISNWISSMEISTKKLFPYLGPTFKCVKNQFLTLLNKKGVKQDAVGIYKLNAKWDILDKIPKINKIDYNWIDNISNFEEHKNRNTDIFSNIYLHMFKELCKKLGFKNCHYIFIDETLERSLRFKWENINIWILTKPEEVLYFNQGKYYFLRGNYHNFYNKLIPINAYSILYPATSFKYNYNIQKSEKIIKRDLVSYFTKRTHIQYNNYKLVLHHEDNNYKVQYPNSKMVLFKKFSLTNTFKFNNKERIYDIIYVCDAIQKSKNHQLLFDFIKYCDLNEIEISIVIVSNKEYLMNNYDNFYLPNSEKVKVIFYDNIKPDKLVELYNQSKINLLFSNRDCVPRVIIESIYCGCYNLSTDLLSDGKYYYDGILGELLSFDYGQVELYSDGMVTYVANPLIFKKIIRLCQIKYDHKKISEEGQKMYNINNSINEIINI